MTTRRTRVAVALAVVAAVSATTVATVRGYRRQVAKIAAATHDLSRSRRAESELHDRLVAARATTAAARAATAAHEHGVRNEDASTRRVTDLALAASRDTDDARRTLRLSSLERVLLGVSADQARTCVRTEHAAMRHILDSDRAAAAADLNAGAGSCSNALAGATGARFPYDFPDPFVLRVGSRYYGFSTNAGAGDVQVITSTDLVDWTLVGNALAALPAWSKAGATWAPSVLHLAARPAAKAVPAVPAKPGSPATPAVPARPARHEQYVLFYTVNDAASGAQCVSSAVSSAPAGPYHDDSTAALICDVVDGGSIDPSPFIDRDGSMWLMWKRERAVQPATIRVQRLGDDGRSLVGTTTDLLVTGRAWEHGVVEAPSMIRVGDAYFLFYAGGVWNTATYATGVARCDTPTGPCHSYRLPVMVGDGTVVGPGGAEVFRDGDGGIWLAYAAYVDPFIGWPYSRTFRLAKVTIDRRGVTVTPE